jgi:hypothetical protein
LEAACGVADGRAAGSPSAIHGPDSIVASFTAAGVEAYAVGPSAVRLKDVVAEIPGAVLEGDRGAKRSWIDALVVTHFQAERNVRSARELPLVELGLQLTPGPDGIAVRRGTEHLATISGSRARVQGETIKGPFLASGPHWAKLTGRLRKRSEPSGMLRVLAQRELPLGRLEVSVHDQRDHLELRRRGWTVATVTPTRATMVNGGRIDGDYYVSGPHWKQLADVLASPRPGVPARAVPARTVPLAATARPQPVFVLSDLPDGLADDVRDATLTASLHLREHRSLVFEHTVVLETDEARIRLLPLTRPPSRLAVPFAV